MSSSDRRAVLRLAALSLGFAVAGCIQPAYMPIGDTDLAAELRSIAVDPIPDRFGHYLGNELIFALNGTGTPGPVKYRLLVTYSQRMQTPIIDTVTGRADSATIFASLLVQLVPAAGGAAIFAANMESSASYDRSSQRYANIRAARNAEILLAKTMADQIRNRVILALAPKV